MEIADAFKRIITLSVFKIISNPLKKIYYSISDL